jgi:amidase
VPFVTDSTKWLDACAQADLVRRGEVSPAELVEAAITRITAANPELDAVLRTRFDEARAEARSPELPDGPFRGVPFLLKDIGCLVAGEVTSFGVGPLRDAAWPVTSYLAQHFQAAGFISLGRTNVPELGTTVTTEARSFPPARNPWQRDHSAGGSSGGAAAAVAVGMVPAAHATDGGGSIRIPASLNGLVGLKPTRGRISQGPINSEGWGGSTTDGVVTRSVRDTAAILDAVAIPMPGDPYLAPAWPRPLTQEVGADPGRLRIGFLEHSGDERHLDHPEVRAAVASTAKLLEAFGHHVEETTLPEMFDIEVARRFTRMIAADVETTMLAFERYLGRTISDDEIEPRNAFHRRTARELTAVEYVRARNGIGSWARRVAAWWNGRDLLLTPTVAAPPPELGWFTAGGPDDERRRIGAFGPYTAPFNLTGQPAVSLPLHWTPDGLPVGVQLVAAYGREDLLVRIASQLEQARPWADRHPAVA